MDNCDTLPIGNIKPGEAWNLALLQEAFGLEGKSGRRQTERLVERHALLPTPLQLDDIARSIDGFRHAVAQSLIEATRRRRGKVIFIQRATTPGGADFMFANDARGGWHWFFREAEQADDRAFLGAALTAFHHAWGKPLLVFAPAGMLTLLNSLKITDKAMAKSITLGLPACPEPVTVPPPMLNYRPDTGMRHLDRLEAEAIHIMREVAAENSNPVMLYSIGKDSAVMLHLALKAFSPGRPPFPLLHVDTGWKFRAMYDFREGIADATGMELIVHRNPDGLARNINPFDHGSALHTEIMKTEGLKQALDAHGFDAAFGGARRDEEKSRAKERIFSFRNNSHQWDPKNQRAELWSLYNSRINKGESIRVFPLSNWTELDIWHYILREQIPIVPLYFAAPRPVVQQDGTLIMVDDDRMPLDAGNPVRVETVRFRTLGCYPLTGAIPSAATTVEDIILELLASRHSEREGRVIDRDQHASMEDKKREGYF